MVEKLERPSGMPDETWNVWKRINPAFLKQQALLKVTDSTTKIFRDLELNRLLLAAILYKLQMQQRISPESSVIIAAGSKNVYEYAKSYFHMGRSTVIAYLKVAKSFLDLKDFDLDSMGVVHSIFYGDFHNDVNAVEDPITMPDFTIAQLIAMSTLANSDAALEDMHELVRTGAIRPSYSTVPDIKQCVEQLLKNHKRNVLTKSVPDELQLCMAQGTLLTAIANFCSLRPLTEDEKSVCDAFIEVVKSDFKE